MAFYRDAATDAPIGWFVGTIPADAIECPAPVSMAATWNGTGWDEPPPEPVLVPLPVVILRVMTSLDLAGLKATFDAALAGMTEQEQAYVQAKLATLKEGIDPADPTARALLAAIGADPDLILAPV